MKFLDLCAGIGGFRLGMERAGHRCVGYVEIDRYARQSYQAMYDTEGEWTAYDITEITDEEMRKVGRDRGVELICGGFPCQPFSTAGKRKGFEDGRGTIIFHFCRFLREIRPRWFVFENVKGLLSHDGGALSEQSCGRLQNWGIAWNGKFVTAKITASRKTGSASTLSAILEERVAEKYFLKPEVQNKIRTNWMK